MWKRLFAFLPVTACALDLQPNAEIKELEGVRIPLVAFKDDGRRVTWRPPTDWRMSYENSRLVLLPKDRTHATMELRVVSRNPGDRELLGDAKTLEAYCATFLPKLSKNIAYRSTKEGPFTIGPLSARECIFDFEESGHSSHASISFVDYSDRQRLVVVVTAQRKDFEAVRAEAIESLFSWTLD